MIKQIYRFIYSLLALFCQQGFSQNWLPLNHGLGCDTYPSSAIYSIYADNATNKIFLSGTFFSAESGEYESCEIETSGAALWDGNRFTNLKGNRYFQQGSFATKFKDYYYTSAPILVNNNGVGPRLLPWNGLAWDSLTGAPDSRVVCSKIINNELWLGGWFHQCGNQPSPMLGKFDGQNFFTVNNMLALQEEVYIGGIDLLHDTIFVGGDFVNYGNNSDDYISTFAKYYNNRLHGIQPTFISISSIAYNCLVNYKNELYLGGYMIFQGEDTVHYFLKYDGKTFSRVGPTNMQMNKKPIAMKVYKNELYILGYFDNLGDQEAQNLVKWDGEKYTILNTDTIRQKTGAPASNAANSLTSFDILNDTLYIAGSFYTIGNDTMRCIAKLNRALSDPIPPPTENSLTLYPNPSSNEVTIGYTLNSIQNVSFSIFDTRGRRIKKIEKGNKTPGKYMLEKVDVSQLAAGIYFVTMQTDKERLVKKLVKE